MLSYRLLIRYDNLHSPTLPKEHPINLHPKTQSKLLTFSQKNEANFTINYEPLLRTQKIPENAHSMGFSRVRESISFKLKTILNHFNKLILLFEIISYFFKRMFFMRSPIPKYNFSNILFCYWHFSFSDIIFHFSTH